MFITYDDSILAFGIGLAGAAALGALGLYVIRKERKRIQDENEIIPDPASYKENPYRYDSKSPTFSRVSTTVLTRPRYISPVTYTNPVRKADDNDDDFTNALLTTVILNDQYRHDNDHHHHGDSPDNDHHHHGDSPAHFTGFDGGDSAGGGASSGWGNDSPSYDSPGVDTSGSYDSPSCDTSSSDSSCGSSDS